MKNTTSSRNRFLLCFRPIDFDPDDMEVDCSPNRVLSYISAAKKRDSNLQRSDSLHNMNARRSFSGTLKTVLFETSLGRKVRDRRERKQLRRSNSNILVTDIQQLKSRQKSRKHSCLKPETVFLDALPPPNTPASEAPEPEILDPSTGNPNGIMKSETEKAFEMFEFMLLVILSLWVTVFWGRLIAVVMTTISFYFVRFCNGVKEKRRRRRRRRTGRSDNGGGGEDRGRSDDVSGLSQGNWRVNFGLGEFFFSIFWKFSTERSNFW